MQTDTDCQPEQSVGPDFYEALQVSSKAEQEVIEAAYKRLALKYHPDLNPTPEATERMQALNAAYAVLSDPVRRAEYDQERIPVSSSQMRRRTRRHPSATSTTRPKRAAKSQAEADNFDKATYNKTDEAVPTEETEEVETDFAQETQEREWAYVSGQSRKSKMIFSAVGVLLVGLLVFLWLGNNQVSIKGADSVGTVLNSNAIFEDDFDTVAGANWIIDSPWHLSTQRAASGTHSLWIGDEGKTGYRTGLDATATLVRPVSLSNIQQPLMRFRLMGQFGSAENSSDRLLVEIAETGHDFETAFSINGSFPVWQDALVDLSKWKGKTILIRFRFNSGPLILPGYTGSYIDDVRIEK